MDETQGPNRTVNPRKDSGLVAERLPVRGGLEGSDASTKSSPGTPNLRTGIVRPSLKPDSTNPRRDSGFSPVRGGLRSPETGNGYIPGAPNLPKRTGRPRLKAFDYQGRYAYHVTIRAASFSKPFADFVFGSRCADQLLEVATSAAFEVLAYCFMPDHVHLLVEGTAEYSDLTKFVSAFKQRAGFAYKKATGNALWQVSYYDRALRREDDFQVLADYVFMNPVKAGLAAQQDEYPLSGGSYFNRQAVAVASEHMRSPEAAADRAEAAVPTSDGDASGASSHNRVSKPEATRDRAEAAVPTSDGAASEASSHNRVRNPEATGDRAEAAVPTGSANAHGASASTDESTSTT